jgi:transcriptional regulator
VPDSAPFVDTLARFVFERAALRGALVSLDDSCREILSAHAYPPALARALAELLAAAALLASTLKFKGSLVVQLQGAGPVRLLVVECSANLELRATAQWNAEAERLPAEASLAALAGDIAKSRLAITLDPKDGGPLYQGIVALAASSIASMIEHYLATSEQIDSRLVLAAGPSRARPPAAASSGGRRAGRCHVARRRRAGSRAGSRPSPRNAGHRCPAARKLRRRHPSVHTARDVLPVQLLRGTGRGHAAHARPGRGRKHSRGTGARRRHLRVLQSTLHVPRRRGARAVSRRPRRGVGSGDDGSRAALIRPLPRTANAMSLYVPGTFGERDRIAIARLLHDYPFATLVTPATPEPLLTHLPLLHVADREPHGTLLGHFARANPHADAPAGAESIAVFHGPHAYVSPSWYAEPAGAVPTWNYAVAHAHGAVELARDEAETRAILDTMIHRFEAQRARPWQLGLVPTALRAMVGAIVGFRIRIRRIDAKFKLSQNRSPEDRRRVAAALDGEGHADASATAAWMRAYAWPGDGNATP